MIFFRPQGDSGTLARTGLAQDGVQHRLSPGLPDLRVYAIPPLLWFLDGELYILRSTSIYVGTVTHIYTHPRGFLLLAVRAVHAL